MYAFSKDPFKPLTEAERAFAAARLGIITKDGEEWLNVHAAARLGRWNALQSVWKFSVQDGWRAIRHIPLLHAPAAKPINYYAKADVLRTIQRLKSKKERK